MSFVGQRQGSTSSTASKEQGPHILIVEDDEAIAVGLKDGFEMENYRITQAFNGQMGLELAETIDPDLILLDVMLPKMNGLDICRQLRGKGNAVPIIMLTARGQEIDKVLGLKLGADDYVTKPFSLAELMARVECVLRRVQGKKGQEAAQGETIYCFGEIEINLTKHEAFKGGEQLELSSREFMLLDFFIQNKGKVVTRDELLNAVWGYESFPYTRTVDTHIAKLRKKIEETPHEPRYLITMHRLGYKFTG